MFDRLDALVPSRADLFRAHPAVRRALHRLSLLAIVAACAFGAAACGGTALPAFANPPDRDSGTDSDSGMVSDGGLDDEDGGTVAAEN